MVGRTEWRLALSALAALAGICLASGREITLFFSQMKEASWAGIALAAALYGALCAGIVGCGLARSACADRVIYACRVIRLLVASMAAAFMLCRLGEMGAMTLPLRHAYAFGAVFGLLGALMLCRGGARWRFGLFVAVYLALFYAANALDARPVRIYSDGYAEFVLAGSVPAALLFAILYACLAAAAAGWSLGVTQPGAARPAALGVKCAALLGGLLCLANLALLRGGEAALTQRLPWVVLSARWGLPGFWLCAALHALCALSTLASALSLLLDAAQGSRMTRAPAIFMIVGAALLFCVLSYRAVA